MIKIEGPTAAKHKSLKRNPFALLARLRGRKVEQGKDTYQRKPKHPKKLDIEA